MTKGEIQKTGRKNRARGQSFETLISDACRVYAERGAAVIQKTPEPMKPLRRLQHGQFVACYTASAQPDYKGALAGGQAVVMEAKATDSDRIRESAVTQAQRDYLDEYLSVGALCWIVARIGDAYFRIPWTVFRSMKEKWGRQYATADELREYQIQMNGYLRFLPEMEGEE